VEGPAVATAAAIEAVRGLGALPRIADLAAALVAPAS
jgi:hypothetical protein